MDLPPEINVASTSLSYNGRVLHIYYLALTFYKNETRI